MTTLHRTLAPFALCLSAAFTAGCGSSNTDALDGPCATPGCVAPDPCEGVVCDTPPAATCADAATLEAWSSSGVCHSGECVYSSQKTTCSLGCEGAACQGDPCSGVVCDSPPGQCQASKGTCHNGVCSYAVDGGRSCNDGDPCTTEDTCSAAGACAGAQLDCHSPPAPACKDATILIVHASTGACDSAGKCAYQPTEVKCAEGCSGGACLGNPCAGVVCDKPPSACHQTTGVCDNGVCGYEFDDGATCNDGDACTWQDACQGGVCAGAAMVCNTPPAPKCLDGSTLQVPASSGLCAAGACSYPPTDVKCAFGCKDGACLGDPCAGVVCDQPDPPQCLSATVLQTHAAQGTCAGGICSYSPSTTECTYGCVSGACQAPTGIVISELLTDSEGYPDTEAFVELHGPPGLALDGLTLVGVNGNGGSDYASVMLTGNIGSDGLFVIAHPSCTGAVAAAADLKSAQIDFQNGPDSVQLRFGTKVLDAVAYGSFAVSDVAAGEGAPAVKPALGESLHRDKSYTDTDDNSKDFSTGAPTPGAGHVETGCDTVLNPGCDCINGSMQPCGSDIGACEFGVQTCANGKWSNCTGGVTAVNEVCGNQKDDDCDSSVDEGCAPPDVFAPGACSGTGMTAAEALALLGSQSRVVLSSATIQLRQRSCGTCAWGNPSDWVIHYLTYSGGVVTRYKDLPATMNLVLFKDGGVPKFSIQHTTFVGSTYKDTDGMLYGFPPAVIPYAHVRAYNFAPASQYDYIELDYMVKDGTVVIGDHCVQWIADPYGAGGPPYTSGYGVVFMWK